jgi:hypothetical protein
MPETTVINIHNTNHYDVKIDRSTIFGNPFTVEKFGREGCIKKYETYFYARLERDPAWKEEVLKLRGKVLAIWDDYDFHGQIICDYLNSLDLFDRIKDSEEE